jgi:mono/diheme cytochrome c family protein
VSLAPAMPSNFYKALTPEDALAVARYLQSVPAVKHPIASPVYLNAWSVDSYPDADRGIDAEQMAGSRLLRGAYLASLAHCMDCHTPRINGAANYERDAGKGGRRYGLGKVRAVNIGSHPVSGLGSWSDAELRRALFEGVSRDGRKLQYPMPWYYLTGLTPDDKDSLVTWVRSLPPHE